MTELVNYHPHSRYTLHEKADLFPFHDLIWRKPDGPFIDLKVDYPDPTNNYADGTAYIRVEDLIEMAHILGMSTREETEVLKKENAELKAKLSELPTKVERYKDELHRVTTSFLADLDSTVSVAVVDVEEPAATESSDTKKQPKPAKAVPKSDKGLVGDDRSASDSDESAAKPSDESSGSKGPDDVSGPHSNPETLIDFLGLGNLKN